MRRSPAGLTFRIAPRCVGVAVNEMATAGRMAHEQAAAVALQLMRAPRCADVVVDIDGRVVPRRGRNGLDAADVFAMLVFGADVGVSVNVRSRAERLLRTVVPVEAQELAAFVRSLAPHAWQRESLLREEIEMLSPHELRELT